MRILIINSAASGTGIGNIVNLLLKFGTFQYDILNVDIFGTLRDRIFPTNPHGEMFPLLSNKNTLAGVMTILNKGLFQKIASFIESRAIKYDAFLLSTSFLQFLSEDLKRKFRIPIVTIFHDLGKVSVYSPKSIFVKLYSLWNAKKIPSSNFIITNSDYTRENLESFLKDRSKGLAIKVIELAIDCTSFLPHNKKSARELLGLPLDKRIILSIGHDYPPKNISSLLRAFDLVEDPNVLLLRVGPLMFSKRTYNKLRDSSLGRIIIRTDVGNDLIPLFYASADLLVYPSLFEGFGLEIVEAAIMGTPSLFSNIKPMNSILKGTRMIDDPNNPEEMCEKIKACLSEGQSTFNESMVRGKLISAYCQDRYVKEMELSLSRFAHN
jgi:glycosyltransferase involved in cell wall biosynthesis